MAAVKALTAFRDKWGEQYKVYVPQGERLEYQQYVALLKDSKLVLSPWGWGEWSHKVRATPTGGSCPLLAAGALLPALPARQPRRARCFGDAHACCRACIPPRHALPRPPPPAGL